MFVLPSSRNFTACRRWLQFLFGSVYLETRSILNFIANNLQSDHIKKIVADLPSFSNPSMITGDIYRPDLLILTKDNTLYVVELTVVYKTNLRNNINCKTPNIKT